jgi:hypothetical protein
MLLARTPCLPAQARLQAHMVPALNLLLRTQLLAAPAKLTVLAPIL